MRRRLVALGILVLFIAGCASFGVKPWTERSPQEKASYFMAIYNKQFNDTVRLAGTPNITEAQKVVVRKKKEILGKLYPAISFYDSIVARGEIPAIADEQAILDLINRLAMEG